MAEKRHSRKAPISEVRKYSEFLQMVRDKMAEGHPLGSWYLCHIIKTWPLTGDTVNQQRLATRIKKDIKAYAGMSLDGDHTTLKTFLVLKGPQPYCQRDSRLWYLDRMIKYWKARGQ